MRTPALQREVELRGKSALAQRAPSPKGEYRIQYSCSVNRNVSRPRKFGAVTIFALRVLLRRLFPTFRSPCRCIMLFQRDLVRAAEHFLRVARCVFPSPIGDPCELPRSPFVGTNPMDEPINSHLPVIRPESDICSVADLLRSPFWELGGDLTCPRNASSSA